MGLLNCLANTQWLVQLLTINKMIHSENHGFNKHNINLMVVRIVHLRTVTKLPSSIIMNARKHKINCYWNHRLHKKTRVHAQMQHLTKSLQLASPQSSVQQSGRMKMKELLPLCGFMLVMITAPAVIAYNENMLKLALISVAQQELNAETMASKQINKSTKH